MEHGEESAEAEGAEAATHSHQVLVHGLVRHSPLVVVLNNLVGGRSLAGRLNAVKTSVVVLGGQVDQLEVVVLGIVVVGQVPEHADVLQTQVVPLVRVGVVGDLVVVHILATAPGAGHLNELTRELLIGSATSVAVLSWDPASVNDDSSAIDLGRVFLQVKVLEGQTTTLVTVEGIDNFEAVDLDAVDGLLLGKEHLSGHVQLTEQVVGLELVKVFPLALGHAPPGVVHISEGSAVVDGLTESVVAVRALPVLVQPKTVLEVSEATSNDTSVSSTVSDSSALSHGHAANNLDPVPRRSPKKTRCSSNIPF